MPYRDMVKPVNNLNYNGYDVLRNDRLFARGGGVGFLIRRELDYEVVDLNPFDGGSLEVLAVKLNCNAEKINLLLVYSPPESFSSVEFDFYINQLPGDILVCGDFNAKHSEWDSNGSNNAGILLHDYVLNHNSLSILTPRGLPTRINTAGGNDTTLDLFLGSSKFIPRSEVNSLADCGSDHLPVSLKLNCFPSWTEIKFRGKWVLNNENWPKWEKKLKESLLELKGSLEEKIRIFSDFLTETAKGIFKHTKGICSPKHSNIWWNEDCARARAERRKAK